MLINTQIQILDLFPNYTTTPQFIILLTTRDVYVPLKIISFLSLHTNQKREKGMILQSKRSHSFKLNGVSFQAFIIPHKDPHNTPL